MKTIETVELVFDKHGVAKFPHVSVIHDSKIKGFAIPETEAAGAKTITGNELITPSQRKVCKLTMKKNSYTFVKAVPVAVFTPTFEKYFFDDLGDIERLDMRSCQVEYTGDDNVEGKALEVVFKYEEK